MKSIIRVMTFLFLAVILNTHKANAGLILTEANSTSSNDFKIIAINSSLVGAFMPGTVSGQFLSLAVLEENGKINQNALEERLSERYSFIHDLEVVKELAQKIIEKTKLQVKEKAFKAKKDIEDIIIIKMEEYELNKILCPADLDPSQVQLMRQDFK